MDNPKDFEEDENKLSKEELDALLEEVENDSRQVVRREQPVKKKNIRFDMIIAAVIAFVIVVGGVLLVRHFVVNTPSKAEKAVAENPLQDDKYPEITDVVKNYLNAFLIEDDAKRAEIIAQYVGNLYDINSVKQRTYVSEYSDVECYTKKGPYDDTYVVYAYYQMGLKNIDTTVPAISRLYVVRDKKTGNVYIQNDSGDDIQKYMNKVTKDSDVQDLLKDVQEEFESVIDFMKEVKFDRLGVFTYSPEEGTPACRMDGQIDEEIKAQRKESIMEAQMEISAELGQKFVGKTLEVIVEGKIEDEDDLYCGRSFRDCYEIDGFVFFKSSEELIAGDFYNIKITSAGDYDLIGERVE